MAGLRAVDKKKLRVLRQRFYYENVSFWKALGTIIPFIVMLAFFSVPALILVDLTVATSRGITFYFLTSTLAYFLIFMVSHRNNPELKSVFDAKGKFYVKREKLLKEEILDVRK